MIEPSSESLFDSLVLQYDNAKSKKLRAKKAYEIAKKAYHAGYFDKAENYVSIAMNLAEDTNNINLKIECMVLSGAVNIVAEQYGEAKKILTDAYQLSYTYKAYKSHAIACIHLSDLFSREGNFEYDYTYLLIAEELCSVKNFTELNVQIKSRFAHYYYKNGKIHKALSTLVALLSDKNNKEYVNLVNSVGVCLDILGYKGHAILCYLEALSEVEKKYSDERMDAYMQFVTTCILMNIVKFYLETEDPQPLTTYYDLLQNHLNKYVIPARYRVNAEILKAKKLIFENKLDEAAIHLNSLLHDTQYTHFLSQKGMIIGALAEIESMKSNIETSAKLMEDSIPYLYHSGGQSYLISSINSYATKLLKLGHFEKALLMAEEALSKSMDMGIYKNAIDTNRLIVEISQQSNNMERELRAYRSIDELEKKIRSSDDQSLYRIAVAYVAINNERDRVQQLNGRVGQLEAELQKKNSELQSMGLQVIHTNKLLSDIEKNIHQWQPNDMSTHFLKSTVHNYLAESSKIEWEMYEKHFSEMYPDFVRLLTKQCPALSLMEVKVCTLIKSQFTSEKIADILCVSRRTVDSHRYRIRKKLSLDPNANLYSYFNQL